MTTRPQGRVSDGRGDFSGLLPYPAVETGLIGVAALAELPLIHDDKASDQFPTWRRYFEATQTPMRDITRGLRFNQSSLAIDAAIKGHEILLGRNRLIASTLADGRLTLVSLGPTQFPGATTPCGCAAPSRGLSGHS